MCSALEEKRHRLGREDLVAGTEGPKDQRRTAETLGHSSPPAQTSEPSDCSVASKDHATAANATPESGAQQGSEEHTKRLLAAYQEILEVTEDLPAVVWVRWDEKGLRRFLKVPYLRLFLRYFLTHHMHKSLSTLDRRLHAIAALGSDPDVNKADRETVKLYLQSLPPPPYKRLALAIFFAALLLALPLRSLGDVTQLLDIVGAIYVRFDVSLMARAFEAKELLNTVRAMLVLLLASSVLASLLASPFALKRMLFNLYPAPKERLSSTAAREHTFSIEGLYALEDRVFREVGLRRPKEVRLDLIFWVFVLMLLLLLSVCLGVLALVAARPEGVTWEVTTEEIPKTVTVYAEDPWIFAVPAIIFFIAFVVVLKRIIIAWRGRNRPASA